MQVILLEKIRNLGSIGEKVNVKSGYGRNYLLPKQKAVLATAENLKTFESKRAELEKTASKALTLAKARAESIEKLTIAISANASEEGKLFGSIGAREIAIAITEAGCEVAKSEVGLPEGPIRLLGVYEIPLQLHSDVLIKAKIQVVAAE